MPVKLVLITPKEELVWDKIKQTFVPRADVGYELPKEVPPKLTGLSRPRGAAKSAGGDG